MRKGENRKKIGGTPRLYGLPYLRPTRVGAYIINTSSHEFKNFGFPVILFLETTNFQNAEKSRKPRGEAIPKISYLSSGYRRSAQCFSNCSSFWHHRKQRKFCTCDPECNWTGQKVRRSYCWAWNLRSAFSFCAALKHQELWLTFSSQMASSQSIRLS